MVYLESSSTDPYFNLALEEYVFEQMDKSKQYFMLWQNNNTIVVGKYQNTAEEINQEFVDERGIRVVRRLSGGGAVYHDKGNLNFTFIVDQANGQEFDFKMFILPVIKALERLGVFAEFNGRNDITIDGEKISGNSQYVKAGRLLHHGCIMLDSNLTNVADALRVKEAKFESKSVKSVRSRVTTINAHAPTRISMDRFKRVLRESILESAELTPYILTSRDMAAVKELRDKKYHTWEWNYGQSPTYTMRRDAKFPAGLITACLQIETGRIADIRFYGDFFGSNDIADLEHAMIGLALDDSLGERVEGLHINTYIHGITAQDICHMLLY